MEASRFMQPPISSQVPSENVDEYIDKGAGSQEWECVFSDSDDGSQIPLDFMRDTIN